MLLFCPTCGNILMVEEDTNGHRFSCNTCPYICNINRKISTRTYPRLKEVDHVMGGAAAWENVDSTDAECPACYHKRAYFMQMQTRSADEPMTTFYKCCNPLCAHNWTINKYAGKMVEKIHGTGSVEAVHVAKRCLDLGDVIALPTDTVYGLACSANNELAIQKLYAIKGRDFHKPVAICVKDIDSLRHWGQAEHLSDALLNRMLPGPITIVIDRSKHLSNRFLNPSTSKIGIRIPDFPFIRNLCDKFDQPLALTSANRSAEQSSLNIQEFECLWPQLGGVFDGGQIGLTEEFRSASTVIDLSIPGKYIVVREGVALKRTLSIMDSFNIKQLL